MTRTFSFEQEGQSYICELQELAARIENDLTITHHDARRLVAISDFISMIIADPDYKPY